MKSGTRNARKKKLFGGKKGNAFMDTLTIIIVLLIVAFTTIFGYKILNEVNDDFQASDDFSNSTKEKVDTLNTNYPTFMDYAYLTALILLWITAIVSSFMIDSHPVFFIIVLGLIIFLLFLAGILSNTFAEIGEESDLSVSSFPIISFIMSNMVLIVLLMGLSIGIALYGKNRLGGSGL